MPPEKHRPAYRWPRTGEKRRTRQPLKADTLPQKARDAILDARAGKCECSKRPPHSHNWEETAQVASAAAGQTISASACARWYDIRIEQEERETRAEAEATRQLIKDFAAKGIEGIPEGALNALASLAFQTVRRGAPPAERQAALGHLLFLASKLVAAQAADKRAGVEDRKVSLAQKKFEQLKEKAEKAVEKAKAKLGKGGGVTAADLDRIKRTVYGI